MEARFQTHLQSFETINQSSSSPHNADSILADGFDLEPNNLNPNVLNPDILDPIVLAESWSLGLAAAVENQRRRRLLKADRENQNLASNQLHNIGTLRFIEDRQQAADSALMDRAATIVDRYDTTSSQSWAPHDWIPQDRITQSWIPQGWTPEYAPLSEPHNPQPFADSGDTTMTPQRARQLLEVAPADTREQIRSAYRRMVGQWHPDRLQLTSKAIRDHATQHMAALNEAYRLLCATELQQAA